MKTAVPLRVPWVRIPAHPLPRSFVFQQCKILGFYRKELKRLEVDVTRTAIGDAIKLGSRPQKSLEIATRINRDFEAPRVGLVSAIFCRSSVVGRVCYEIAKSVLRTF